MTKLDLTIASLLLVVLGLPLFTVWLESKRVAWFRYRQVEFKWKSYCIVIWKDNSPWSSCYQLNIQVYDFKLERLRKKFWNHE